MLMSLRRPVIRDISLRMLAPHYADGFAYRADLLSAAASAMVTIKAVALLRHFFASAC